MCEDNSVEWFEACAEGGDTACQMLHATKVGNGGLSQEKAHKEMIKWNRRAAENGSGAAAVKMARAYLGSLPTPAITPDPSQGKRFLEMAVASCDSPDGHYGLAQLLIHGMAEAEKREIGPGTPPTEHQAWAERAAQGTELRQAVAHLEAAARGMHPYSQFNLGLAHLYGYGVRKHDQEVAAEWFEARCACEEYSSILYYLEYNET